MKKVYLLAVSLLLATLAKADSIFVTPQNPDPFSVLGGQFQGTLITHVQAIDQVADGGNKLALLDSILLIGHLKQDFLLHGRVGYSATRAENGQYEGSGWLVSAFIPVNNIVRSYFTIPSHYEFLNGLHYGPAYNYSFKDHHAYLSFDFGWSYGPSGS